MTAKAKLEVTASRLEARVPSWRRGTRLQKHKVTAKAKLEVIASRLEARVPSWRPALPGYKSARKNTRQSKLEVLARGGGQGTKLEASATRLQEAQRHKKHKTASWGPI